MNDPSADLKDRPALFGSCNKFVRREQPLVRVLPPDERFEADQTVGFERDDRLIVQNELIAVDGPLEVLL